MFLVPPPFTKKTTVAGVTFPLDFTGGSLPSGCSFTRASSGTRLNISGVLVTETTDVARFDYNPAHTALGILIEPSRTNLLLRSEEAENAAYPDTGNTKTANAIAGPDGNTVGDKVTFGGTETFRQGWTGVSGTVYTISTIAKYFDSRWLCIQIRSLGGGGRVRFWFDVQNGVSGSNVTASGGVFVAGGFRDLGGGWYEIYVTGSLTATDHELNVFTCTADGSTSLSGGTSLYVAGQQSELGSTKTSYSKTTSATVTRSADALSFTIGAGVTTLRYTFDDSSTQDVSVSAGSYNVPTNLNRRWIKTIASVP